MGGEIGVRSRLGEGSTFWVRVAFDVVEGAPAAILMPAGKRALIVDDTPANCSIFERQLASWGLEAVSVGSGDLALAAMMKAAAQGHPFDLLISDHHMPGMDGYELALTLKGLPMFSEMPIVLVSSGGGEHVGGVELFQAVFSKPVRPSELQACLARLLGAVAAPSVAPVAAAHRAAAPVKRHRLLVAEDNHINARVALGYLENAGHRVDLVATGLEAVEAVRRLPYDMVLMDMQMPELDGLEATRAIRKLTGERGRIPIVALTANAMAADSERCLAAGMNDHLPKPFDKAVLLDKVRYWGEIGAALHAPRARNTTPPLPGMALPGMTAAAPAPAPAPAMAEPTPAPTVAPAPSDLRQGFLAQIAELSDLGDLAFRLAADFAAKVAAYEVALTASRDNQEHAELGRLAHEITGSAGTLGFQQASATARRLQVLAGRDLKQSAELVETLLAELREIAAFVASEQFTLLRSASGAQGLPSAS